MNLLFVLLAAVPESNLLSLEAGTVVVQAPASWGGTWTPEALSDGDASTGWCNAVGTQGPYVFVYELEQRSVVTSLEVNDANTEESSNPGCSARGVELWVSSSSANEGFTKVAVLPLLKKSGQARVALPRDTVARWVRLVVPGNLGHASYTELMEVAVQGHGLEPAVQRSVAGTWRLEGGGLLKLTGEGTTLSGCVTFADSVWSMKGEARGRAASLSWTEEAGTGSATVALGDDGALRARWKKDAGSSGTWTSMKRAEAELDCRTALEDLRFARRLRSEAMGLTLTGVSFDVATDELKLDARHELGALERMLAAGGQRVRVLVLGRTAEAAPDELKRCERRAQRLLAHLQRAGVPTSTVDVGVGMLRVGAAVQLEPRVEVLLLR